MTHCKWLLQCRVSILSLLADWRYISLDYPLAYLRLRDNVIDSSKNLVLHFPAISCYELFLDRCSSKIHWRVDLDVNLSSMSAAVLCVRATHGWNVFENWYGYYSTKHFTVGLFSAPPLPTSLSLTHAHTRINTSNSAAFMSVKKKSYSKNKFTMAF